VKETSEIPERVTPHRTEIADAMKPYLVERLSVHAEEWREHRRRELKAWRRKLWRRRLRQFSFAMARQQAQVRETYSSAWSKLDWPTPGDPKMPVHFYDWHDEGLKAHFWGMKRIHQRLLWRCLGALQPKTVLEVGAGNGLNLLALSTAFPGMRWAGIDLSPMGVTRAKEVQHEPELPPAIPSFCSWKSKDLHAYRGIDFREGDAQHLAFGDRSFDLVFSVLALEQMEAIRDAAVSEVARVSAQWVVMIEPFADFNRDPLRHACTRAKGYFSLRLKDLKRFGLEPTFVFDDIPQKITLGAGLVIARKL
jgi:ubiquinone/menaquinone biosynthesis C-methylase UbiE